ncbi:hypothetical protein F7725_011771 [Dissostichus mawsoni]|uniref:UDP-glucuronosyltransferase n=1 Tax=Dissostichus mawsoni TaxID=36200 RepID=A0A7J5ZAJ2_DISMA|nr:hypothetical protein F7725_011771 [Dissostichus mawsoni]
MWKSAVFLFLLLNVDMQVSGAVDKTVAENSTPEKLKTEEAAATSNIPARDNASSGYLGNLLVVPMDGSHWVGIKAIAQEMGRRGHRVTVVIPEVSIRMGPGKHYDTLTYPVPYDQAHIDYVMSSHIDVMKKSAQSFTEKVAMRFSQIKRITGFIHTTAESLLFNASVISHLARQNFDAVLTDPLVPTGSLIARKLAYQFLGEEVGVAEMLSESAIWLLRLDFTLEFPRPLMPNMVLVGGINCHVRNPLPEDLESWLLDGEHGFVVFTLGTMASDLPEETTSVFLEAFRQIPQKVVWRYTGPVPDNVPENVKFMKWAPQNDLLGGYKENVQKLSDLHKDRLVDPLDLSVYWTEYVMRNKGAKHLKLPSMASIGSSTTAWMS